MSRRVWILAALTIVGSWVLLSLRPTPSPATLNDVPQERDPLPAREPQTPLPSASAEAEARRPTQSAPAEPEPPRTPSPAQPERRPAQPEPQPAAEAQPKRNPLAPERAGPIVELTQRFEHEPRPSNAGESEATIRAQFSLPGAPPGILENVTCRATVCKLELRWSELTADAYMAGVMHAYYSLNFQSMASEPSGTPEAGGGLRVVMYFGMPSDSEP